MDTKQSEILKIAEAAAFTRLRPSTIYAYVARRRIPFLKVGAKVLFERSALEGWLASHRVNPLSGSRSAE